MKEFIIFVCTASTEIFFSKLRSAGLNYNLPSFSLTFTVRGVSNKHCLLTFFINHFTRISIYHECECGIENIILRITDGSYKPCLMITNCGWEGWIFLSHPTMNDILFSRSLLNNAYIFEIYFYIFEIMPKFPYTLRCDKA